MKTHNYLVFHIFPNFNQLPHLSYRVCNVFHGFPAFPECPALGNYRVRYFADTLFDSGGVWFSRQTACESDYSAELFADCLKCILLLPAKMCISQLLDFALQIKQQHTSLRAQMAGCVSVWFLKHVA